MDLTNGPIYGNYHGYYKKRGQLLLRDPRLALLDKGLFNAAKVLDIGCNEGWVTYEIAVSYKASQVVGVDIDEDLIQAAQKLRRQIWSQYKPSDDVEHGHCNGASENSASYFPASFAHSFGPLPIPNITKSTTDKFPHNVIFRVADWANLAIIDDADGYDVIVAFSVTKWIHLHNGDTGLVSFFRRVYSVLHPGGWFILEPQEWDSYQRSQRINKSLRETYKELKIRPDNFSDILVDIGFRTVKDFGPVKNEYFRNRTVNLYTKPDA